MTLPGTTHPLERTPTDARRTRRSFLRRLTTWIAVASTLVGLLRAIVELVTAWRGL